MSIINLFKKFRTEENASPRLCYREYPSDTLNFAIWHKFDGSYESWERWVEGARGIFALINVEPTNCSVGTLKKEPGLLKYKSLERRIERAKREEDSINYIHFYALPPDYTTLVFDVVDMATMMWDHKPDVTYLRFNKSYISIDNLDADKIIEILRKMVPNGNGEIFLMDNEECPMMYPSGLNTPDFYKTLEVVRYF